MIVIRNLRKSYGSHELFKGLNLEVKKGEVIVFIGPSGSGKSTLLRNVNGLETYESGEIMVDGDCMPPQNGHALSRESREAIRRIRCKVGMVFQQFNLFPHLTVLDNIMEAPMRVLKEDPAKVRERAIRLLERVNLGHKAASYPPDLSGGQQQRVAISRALAMKPEAMLFDEPTSALDPEMVGEVLQVIRDLVNEGMTTLIVTHEMDFARDIADRIVILENGQIIEEGPPEEIFTKPKTERTASFLSRVLKNRFAPQPADHLSEPVILAKHMDM